MLARVPHRKSPDTFLPSGGLYPGCSDPSLAGGEDEGGMSGGLRVALVVALVACLPGGCVGGAEFPGKGTDGASVSAIKKEVRGIAILPRWTFRLGDSMASAGERLNRLLGCDERDLRGAMVELLEEVRREPDCSSRPIRNLIRFMDSSGLAPGEKYEGRHFREEMGIAFPVDGMIPDVHRLDIEVPCEPEPILTADTRFRSAFRPEPASLVEALIAGSDDLGPGLHDGRSGLGFELGVLARSDRVLRGKLVGVATGSEVNSLAKDIFSVALATCGERAAMERMREWLVEALSFGPEWDDESQLCRIEANRILFGEDVVRNARREAGRRLTEAQEAQILALSLDWQSVRECIEGGRMGTDPGQVRLLCRALSCPGARRGAIPIGSRARIAVEAMEAAVARGPGAEGMAFRDLARAVLHPGEGKGDAEYPPDLETQVAAFKHAVDAGLIRDVDFRFNGYCPQLRTLEHLEDVGWVDESGEIDARVVRRDDDQDVVTVTIENCGAEPVFLNPVAWMFPVARRSNRQGSDAVIVRLGGVEGGLPFRIGVGSGALHCIDRGGCWKQDIRLPPRFRGRKVILEFEDAFETIGPFDGLLLRRLRVLE